MHKNHILLVLSLLTPKNGNCFLYSLVIRESLDRALNIGTQRYRNYQKIIYSFFQLFIWIIQHILPCMCILIFFLDKYFLLFLINTLTLSQRLYTKLIPGLSNLPKIFVQHKQVLFMLSIHNLFDFLFFLLNHFVNIGDLSLVIGGLLFWAV